MKLITAYFNELEKIAATRQVKELRRLVQGGRPTAAEALARKLESAGVLKKSRQGTNIGRLGSGAEAFVDLTAGASKVTKGSPLTARKVFDQKGAIFGTDALAEKMNAGRRIRRSSSKSRVPRDFAGLRSTRVGKGGTGGRFLHYDFIRDAGPAQGDFKSYIGGYLRDSQRKVNAAKKARVVISREQIAAARAEKRVPIIQDLMRRGHSREKAEARALEMIPHTGGPRLGDLHSGNLRENTKRQLKVVDYTAIPAHREKDIERSSQYLTGRLQRDKQLIAKTWRARLGTNTTASQIGQRHRAGRGVVPSGLSPVTEGGDKARRRVLGGLGPGSRQAKKVRGAKVEMTTSLREKLQQAVRRAAQAEGKAWQRTSDGRAIARS